VLIISLKERKIIALVSKVKKLKEEKKDKYKRRRGKTSYQVIS